jgi:hypothetical protein
MSDESDVQGEPLGQGGMAVPTDNDLASRANALFDAAQEADDDPDDGDGVEDDDDEARSASELRGRRAPYGKDRPKSKVDPDEDESYSRLRLNASRQARQLTEASGRVKALEAEVARLSEAARVQGQEPDDVVELVQATLMRRLGVKDASDPKLIAAIQELATDLTLEGFRDAADRDESLRARREQRQRERAEARRHAEYQRQIDELRMERLQAQRAQEEARGQAMVAQFVGETAADYPYMNAAAGDDFDPAAFIFQAAEEGIASGKLPQPRSVEDVREVLHRVAGNLEAHYRGLAERISARTAGKRDSRLLSGKTRDGETDGRRTSESHRAPAARDRGRDGRSTRDVAPTRGGGGRGTPGPSAPVDPDEPDDLAARFRRMQRAARRA